MDLRNTDAMVDIDVKQPEALHRAMAFHRAGNLVEAEQLYRAILNGQQDHPVALHMLGVLEFQCGRARNAIRLIDEALAIMPDYVEALIDRANILCALDRLQEALGYYDEALAIRPDHTSALYNRGYALQRLDRHEEALASYDRTLAVNPNAARVHNNRGNVLSALNRFPEALDSYDRALAIEPRNAEALNNRGTVLNALKRPQDALQSYDGALAINPDAANVHNNRGNVLFTLHRFEEALQSYDQALAKKPNYAEALSNRGSTLEALGRPEEALESYDRALAINPIHVDALLNRGNVLRELKRLPEALASYDRGLALDPDHVKGHFYRACSKLLVGRYTEGWSDYESRAPAQANKHLNIDAPTWQGEDLSGRQLLVLREQGFGDTIQFSRYLPLLVERESKVSFLAPAKLTRLLRPSMQSVEFVRDLQDVVGIDFQISLMSLPYRFKTELSSIPNKVPYLKSEPELEAHWRVRIGTNGFKIGIAWQGGPDSDQARNIPLEEFVLLTRIPGVRLISLQKGAGLDQLVRLSDNTPIENLGDEFDNGPDAFIDTAAMMSVLDLIITSDTSIPNLGGALGRPTWLALKYVPEWRWLLDREDSPWYPTVRLFRQPKRGDWRSVFVKIEQKLRALIGATA